MEWIALVPLAVALVVGTVAAEVIAYRKGHYWVLVVGWLFPPAVWIAAMRPADPYSPWPRRRSGGG